MDHGINITQAAATQLKKVLAGEPPKVFRISIFGGGCSGFQYKFAIENTPKKDDIKISVEQATVVIDPVSVGFLANATLDFENELVGSQFVIKNPNAATSCGCGSSFSI